MLRAKSSIMQVFYAKKFTQNSKYFVNLLKTRTLRDKYFFSKSEESAMSEKIMGIDDPLSIGHKKTAFR